MTQQRVTVGFLPQPVEDLLDGLKGYAPQTIILFGSSARVDTHEFSDIDLMVIKDTEHGFWERRRNVEAFLPQNPDLEVDVFVYTPAEFAHMAQIGNPFVGEALREGLVVYNHSLGTTEIRSAWEWSKEAGIHFMPNSLRTARRWLAMADRLIEASKLTLAGEHFYDVCFKCHQAVEFALKAFLYFTTERLVRGHSISELALHCARQDTDFAPFAQSSEFMQDYYTRTRYVDMIDDPFSDLVDDLRLPSDIYSREQAEEALIFVADIIASVRSKLPPGDQ